MRMFGPVTPFVDKLWKILGVFLFQQRSPRRSSVVVVHWLNGEEPFQGVSSKGLPIAKQFWSVRMGVGILVLSILTKTPKTGSSRSFSQQEVYWRQRSKQLWLQAGDLNTRYFHASDNSRRWRHHNSVLKNEDGIPRDWEHGLGNVMIDYFRRLFSASETNWRL